MRDPLFPEEQGIFFHQESTIPELPAEEALIGWIENILYQEGKRLQAIYYVFIPDSALLEINQTYLKHDTLTDIITFPYKSDPVEAEIYISAERVRANAAAFRVPVLQEFLRVIAHGVLHLCGWDDHTDHGKRLMRLRENACLALFGIQPDGYSISPV